ncbi:UV-stimulated scaffold protein A [Trichechus manatus latirostris]|uniref:UV-stimulated scaffold protein A n=1 Tax=Trichechus manatus latirostris TaxID=127582 RepID=A0A2Y9DYN9_TRIMA|nr:UV-stimulated scaffold protein A [Trichechus manatus latirostris]
MEFHKHLTVNKTVNCKVLGCNLASLHYMFLDMDQELSRLVEELTTSGESLLNPEKMKELKKICKSSEDQLRHAYHLLMTQLNQEHAEIRLSAFQVVDALFARSHQFRVLVVSNFQEFLELTLGTDHEQPLPPPREVAQKLRRAAIQAVEGWNEKYGEAYKKLALGYHFLRHNKQVDFQDVNARTVAERKREEEKQKRLDNIYRERAKQAEREMEEMSAEVRSCLTEVENCFRLLVPFDFATGPRAACPIMAPGVPDEDALPSSSLRPASPGLQDEEQPCCSRDLPAFPHSLRDIGGRDGPPEGATGDLSEEEHKDQEEFLRSHGLGSHKYTLDLELCSDDLQVQENEDNSAVMHSARDALKLIQNKFLPSVCSWVQLFTRAGIHDQRLKHAIDVKTELEVAVRKYEELHIKPQEGPRRLTAALGDGSEDEDEFVEVPEKEGYEPHIPDHLRAEYGLDPVAPVQTLEKDPPGASAARALHERTRRDEEASDPTSAAAQLRLLRDQLPPPSSSSPSRAPLGPDEAQKLAAERARAPVVPFGVDLCYWGQEELATGKILKADSLHRFWGPSEVDEEVDNADVSEMLRSRHITFAGRFEPVQHRCRAPRPDGRLCERQDRLKCPFHGKIIPRDDRGQPLNAEDRAREQRQQLQRQAECPDWQDPEFMRDVEATVKVDLGSSRYGGKGKGKGKKRKYPNLTDLKQQADTARARIGKKVFDKAAVRRVITAMNQMDRKKHEKFANQFNYALN